MKVDVIIPTYQPGKRLFRLLDSLEKQSMPLESIIIMNTGREYLERLITGTGFEERYPNVKIYHLEKGEFDHGATRHKGVQYSESEIFMVMTQDAMPVDCCLVERLTGALKPDIAVAYARQLPGKDSSEFEKISRAFNYPEESRIKTAADLGRLGIKTFFCSNVCAAYRRDVYEESGGFIRHTIFNEDMIYAAGAIKAGYGIAYVADAKVIHSHNYTNVMQLRRNFDLGVSQANHPEIFQKVTSEAEGKKLVKEAWNYFKQNKCPWRFPGFCLQCGFKYTGYLLGKHYKALPRTLILGITTNKEYWT